MGTTINGRRLVLHFYLEEASKYFVNLKHLLRKYKEKGVMLMLTVDTFISIVSLIITCIALGYTLAQKSKK